MNKKFINYTNDDTISRYFKELKKSKSLTTEEEVNLAIKIKKGDQKAIDELVNANLKFVISIAKEYQGQGLTLSDLINEGNYGLIKAATRFDHTRGFKFISYAVWWVKQSIIQSLNDNARVVRLPANVINKISKLNKELGNGEDNENDVINDISFFDETMLSSHKAYSLNQSINEDGCEIIDLIIDEELENDIDEGEVSFIVKKELENILSILDERERVIIECYFGINSNHDGMTLEAIGDTYQLTKERIRQIKEKAIRKLRFNTKKLQTLINL